MTPDEAYTAINHLRSVLCVPRRDKAHEKCLKPFHKSFIDYISDSARSEFSPEIKHEARQMKTECIFRILNEAPDGIDFDMSYGTYHDRLVRGPGTGDKISLTWVVDEKSDWNDSLTRLNMYKLAIGEVISGMEHGDPTFQSMFCIHLLISRFQHYGSDILHNQLRDSVFVSTQ
jgi:hypothetical protein